VSAVRFRTRAGRWIEFEARERRSDPVARRLAASAAREAALCRAFRHPAGTPVVVFEDDGRETRTRTRSLPWMLGADGSGAGGHTAVVLLDDRSGGYSLSRVRPASEAT
jgi:hypothetical protein